MNIDLDDKSSVDNLLTMTKLKNQSYQNQSVDAFITSVWDTCSKIWENIDLTTYTNHNLEHSLNIIKYFMLLNKVYKWSLEERILFVCAALIHDIGMQYNKWAPSETEDESWPIPPLDQIEIRKKHVKLGYQLIHQQINDTYSSKFPQRMCINNMVCNNILWKANYIAASHSGTDFLEALKSETTTWNSIRRGTGNDYRPRLIAGILRLCDELDGDEKRILEKDNIDGWNLSDESKRHWMSCLFIKETVIEIIENLIKITLIWQVSDNASETQVSLVKQLVEKMRILKINNEIKFIYDFFKECNESLLASKATFEVIPLNDMPAKFFMAFDDKFSKIIESYIRIQSEPVLKKTVDLNRKKERLKEDTKAEESTSQIIFKHDDTTLENALRIWFNKEKIQKHVVLINKNEHTDTYVNCRTLVSNPELIRRISEHIYDKYKNKRIDCLLAVGTSSIPLSIYLSHRFKCAVTYTISKERVRKKEAPSQSVDILKEYVSTEIRPIIKPDQTILILDDIVSGGNVAKEVLDGLYDLKGNFLPNKVFHFSIFKLGDRELKKDNRIENDFDFILEIKNVLYAESADVCPQCLAGNTPIYEKEMY